MIHCLQWYLDDCCPHYPVWRRVDHPQKTNIWRSMKKDDNLLVQQAVNFQYFYRNDQGWAVWGLTESNFDLNCLQVKPLLNSNFLGRSEGWNTLDRRYSVYVHAVRIISWDIFVQDVRIPPFWVFWLRTDSSNKSKLTLTLTV